MKRLARRAGRRGAFLAFLAILDAAVGYSLLTAPAAETGALHMTLPVTWWAWVWIAVGALCAAGVFVRRDRIPYSAAAALKAAWALATARAWLTWHTPQGWVGVIIWAAFAVTVLLVASWPEAPRAQP